MHSKFLRMIFLLTSSIVFILVLASLDNALLNYCSHAFSDPLAITLTKFIIVLVAAAFTLIWLADKLSKLSSETQ